MYLSSYKNVFARGKDSGVKNGAKMQRQRPKEPKSCSSTAQSASNEINFHPKTVCLLHTFQNLLQLSTFAHLRMILIPIPPRLQRASSSSLLERQWIEAPASVLHSIDKSESNHIHSGTLSI